jgi:hypothetical protein
MPLIRGHRRARHGATGQERPSRPAPLTVRVDYERAEGVLMAAIEIENRAREPRQVVALERRLAYSTLDAASGDLTPRWRIARDYHVPFLRDLTPALPLTVAPGERARVVGVDHYGARADPSLKTGGWVFVATTSDGERYESAIVEDGSIPHRSS